MSVWTDIGMREGMFYGVVPEFFLRNAFSFFSLLRNQCRKSVDPDHTVPDWEKYMDFFAREKHRGARRDIAEPYNDYWNYFTYFFIRPDQGSRAPIGAPIPEYLWCEPPKWEKTNFTEAEILGESEIFSHPAVTGTEIPRTAPSLDWHKQRYRLIQKGRYCIVPITTNVKYDGEWLNMTSAGYINDENFGWWYVRGLKFSFDDFWFQEGVDARIGIYNEHVGGAAVFPFQGAYWFQQKTVTLIPEEEKRWDGYSILRVYGIIDLSTHPDFAEYFDTVSVECPSLPEPPSATPSSSSSWLESSSMLPPSQSVTPPSESKSESESGSKPPVTDPCKRYPPDHTIYFTIYVTMSDVNTGECFYDFSFAEEAVRRADYGCSVNNIDGTFELYYQSEYVGYYVSYDIKTGKFVRGRIDTYNFPPIVAEKPEKPDCWYGEYAVIEIY